MLELVARHGGVRSRDSRATGDLDVDQHHTVEDLGIALGEAVSKALGTRRGINRAGYFIMPMDETLGVAAVDLGGRPHAVVDLALKVERVGDLQSELIHDFFEGFALGVRGNVHVKVLYGRSSHHHVEAVFKAFGRALRVGLLEGPPAGAHAAEHEGTAVIALIDYGAGNLTSVRKALHAVGADVAIPPTPVETGRVLIAVIVPGVGNFLRDGRRSTRTGAKRSSASIEAGTPAARHLPRPAVAVRRQHGSAGLRGAVADDGSMRSRLEERQPT